MEAPVGGGQTMKQDPRGLRERLVARLASAGVLDLALRVRGSLPPTLLSVFTFHRVAEPDPHDPFDPDVVDATPSQFRRVAEMLALGGTPITIDSLIRSLETGELPRNPFMLTFDDGYRSCVDVVLPILLHLGIPATFFIPTAFPEQSSLFWWDKIAAMLAASTRERVTLRYPRPRMLEPRSPRCRTILTAIVKDTPGLDLDTFFAELAAVLDVEWSDEIEQRLASSLIASWAQVRGLADAAMDVESHTHSHRVLETLDACSIRDELVRSRAVLEAHLERPVRALAYPVGRQPAPHVQEAVANAGYRIAFTNSSGGNRVWSGPLRGAFPLDRLALRRHATERSTSDAMLFAQFVLPEVAY